MPTSRLLNTKLHRQPGRSHFLRAPARLLLCIGLVLVLVLAVTAVACKPAGPPPTPPPPAAGGGPGPSTDPLAHLVLTARPHNLGKTEVEYPAHEKLLDLPDDGGKAPADQVWLLMADGLGRPDAEAIAGSWGASVIGEIEFVGLYQLKTSDTTLGELEARLKQASSLAGVVAALPNAALPVGIDQATAPTVEPCDPTTNANYRGANARPHQIIGLKDAWAMINASGLELSPVQIGVVDDAAWGASPEINHDGGPRLLGLTREDVMGSPVGDSLAADNHGTQVLHTMAADHRVGGVIGVASILGDKLLVSVTDMWKQAVVPPEGPPDPDDPRSVTVDGHTFWCDHLIRLMRQVEAGATVINSSFGPRPPSDPDSADARRIRSIHAAYTRFAQHLATRFPNVLLVGSAGNNDVAINETNRYIGQRLGNVMTIGALDPNGLKAGFSNYMGPDSTLEVSLAAPGVGIVTNIRSDGTSITANGTSFSTPIVAGAAAILRSIKPDISAAEVKRILVETAATTVRTPDDLRDVRVPVHVSGRILRVDSAVLRVINLVRRERGLAELTREQLLGLGGFSVSVSGGPAEYVVKASVQEVAPVGAQLTLAVLEGQVSLATAATVKLTAPGEAAWTVRRAGDAQDTLLLQVTRVESGACARLTVPYVEVSQDLEVILASQLIYVELGGRVHGLRTDASPAKEVWDNIGAGVDGGRRYFPPHPGDWTVENSSSAWDGLTFAASYRLSRAVNMSFEAAVRLTLAADGRSIEWLEFRLDYKDGDRQTWREEWRLEGVPIEGPDSRLWGSNTPPQLETVLGGTATSNHADVSGYLTKYHKLAKSQGQTYEYDLAKAENLRLRVMFLQAP